MYKCINNGKEMAFYSYRNLSDTRLLYSSYNILSLQAYSMEKRELESLFKQWCKETERSGGVLLGKSLREFFEYVELKTKQDERNNKTSTS